MPTSHPLRTSPRTRRESSTTDGRRVGWLPLVACCLGTFLLLLYTSVVTVALPSIGAGLGAGHGAEQWIVDVYTLALAGLLLGAGSIGDALGRRRVYLVGAVGFTLATAACGLAVTPAWLIAARAVQGVAGAAMFATILPLIGLTYVEPSQKAIAFAVWGTVAGAASAVGTVGGGVLSQYAGWRWLFLGTVPLSLVALALAARSLPRPRRTGSRPRMRSAGGGPPVDWAGIVLVSVTVTASAWAIISAGESGWAGRGALIAWSVAGCAGIGLVLVERAVPRPILPLALVTTPRFVAILLVAFGYYFAAFGALPVAATWLQTGLGLTSMSASLILVVQLICFMVVSGLVSPRLRLLSPSWTLGAGTVLIGVGALSATTLPVWTHWLDLLPFLVLSGIGAGVVSPVLPALAIASAPARHAGAASSAANAARQLGLALGVALCGTFTSHRSTGSTVALAFAASALTALVLGGAAIVLLRARRPHVAEHHDHAR